MNRLISLPTSEPLAVGDYVDMLGDVTHVVLDVACGTGGFTRTFANAVGPDGLAIGLDASRTMLARAVAAGGNAEYLRADAVRPPLHKESLDAVCCFAAPFVALDSFAALLKPGERVAFLTSGRRASQPLRTIANGDSATRAAAGGAGAGRAGWIRWHPSGRSTSTRP